ncbi:MAG: NUDIX hydrolase N-terminal domain-containing protein [Acidobacteriota bacterium]|nr:MAG: NUDIX hydrolase N-terminal domain-containing protein [Acidobacteriota bacterium]
MTKSRIPDWLRWAREIQSLAQTGLHFAEDEYNTFRYSRLLELSAEMVEMHTHLPRESTLESFRVQPGYATPKVDVRGAIVREGRVLLVQERVDERWCMPGGWADVGETPAEMVEREVREESGLIVKARQLIGVYDANRDGEPLEFFHAYKLVFLCEEISGEPAPSDETLAAEFFAPDQIPPLSTQRTSQRHLDCVFAFSKDPRMAPYFE